jgi:putative ABC transport system permease protein
MAHYAEQHTRDISIRLALGGSARRVLGLLVGQGMVVVAAGVVVGLAAALALARFTTSLLFGVGASDPRAYLAVAALLALVAALACLLPARRALRAAPATVLRSE